jgi:solute carrier family 1 (high affinity glutamate transporter) protein 1
LRCLRMIVIPLVVTSVMAAIVDLGDLRGLWRPLRATLVYFLGTTLLAVAVGLIVTNVIQPGRGSTLVSGATGGLAHTPDPSTGGVAQQVVKTLFTDNLFASAVEGNLLPLIVFGAVFAGVVSSLGHRAAGLANLAREANEALLGLVQLILRAAPVGIFCLVAARFGQAVAAGQFGETLARTGLYMLTVVVGLGVHALLLLPVILWLTTRRNPVRFVAALAPALLTAFSTASSAATLPLTLRCTEERAGVRPEAVRFVIPLATTVNLNGTALYEGAAVLFIAQVMHIPLGLSGQIAMGAGGIPEAGLVTMVLVLKVAGLPAEHVGLIIAVDWLLDRVRTAVNVLGDAIGSAVVESRFEPGAAAQSSAVAGVAP